MSKASVSSLSAPTISSCSQADSSVSVPAAAMSGAGPGYCCCGRGLSGDSVGAGGGQCCRIRASTRISVGSHRRCDRRVCSGASPSGHVISTRATGRRDHPGCGDQKVSHLVLRDPPSDTGIHEAVAGVGQIKNCGGNRSTRCTTMHFGGVTRARGSGRCGSGPHGCEWLLCSHGVKKGGSVTVWDCKVCHTRMYTRPEYKSGRHRECEILTTRALTLEDLNVVSYWLRPLSSPDIRTAPDIAGA